MDSIDWKNEHILFIANEIPEGSDSPDKKQLRSKIEPWLTAVFQSEHLSLLLGTGVTTGICSEAKISPQAMQRIEFTTEKERIKNYADTEAQKIERGRANFEDDLRTAIELLKGLKILQDAKADTLEQEINDKLKNLIENLLKNEKAVLEAKEGNEAISLLKRFLISFSSRTATRDRLNIFTTNYDRFIEYTLDSAGIHTLDRFVGKLNPIMRMHKMELDFHYNPPGIRGEPRYVEGVVRYTKLHGSLDWCINDEGIQKKPIPFGTELKEEDKNDPYERYIIYPNSAKGIDTAYFPYSELFRDLSTATCRPNSVLVTYGYGFGDSHINSILLDMITIPSTHLVIISFDKADGRIQNFVEKCNLSQITLLIGNHFGQIRTLTENYLPKSAIDRISDRKQKIVEKRGFDIPPKNDDLNE
ncbi:fibronectin-binding protein (FBP) [Leptospira noumeaensis]|uniref:Fibronectin-binding protein (FBP) n=1 Tax=Leptospira noumeaensis TaxID=2484964 RepID=A0A4R9I795_9LEPT|nr:SIR2 family protein [Leptospira noumeaensis]TGK82005.1 fibronectin-binding protein (FBP) [Leptospira noumeaensis]